MPTLPESIIAILAPYVSLFTKPVFRHVRILLVGAILTTGRHTVANALRMMGLAHTRRFGNFHRVLSRAKWSSRRAAKVLLNLLIDAFVPDGELLVGLDETLERRRGEKIAAKGIYRDAVRSSKSQVVKSSGLRWIAMTLLAPIPFTRRKGSPPSVWSLPFFTVLAPSERYHQEHNRNHKTIVIWAEQMVVQLRRWLSNRKLVVVGDNSYAALWFLDRCRRFKNPVTAITRLRLDAALYEPAPSRQPGQKGRPRKVGVRLPSPQQVIDDKATVWTPAVVPVWYGQLVWPN